ncbi:MAG: leucine-rich repeat protein [Bacilli bacterium]|nr:leucine-rich repeat protein [Bacilli bacterium]
MAGHYAPKKPTDPLVRLKSRLEGFIDSPDRYVYSFEIREKTRTRSILTYNKASDFGMRLRRDHEQLLEAFMVNFAARNPHSFAYHKSICCRDALTDHLRSTHFIKLDIHHFFESISPELFFAHYGERFNPLWKGLLQGCFYKDALSIGFVTSPALSDFYMGKFDEAMEQKIRNNPRLHYSRYCDDILLSSEEEGKETLDALFEETVALLGEFGLSLNEKKTSRVSLSLEKHNSISFLGLNLSKKNEVDNKVTISKRYILFLLFLIEKNRRYDGGCQGLVNEINSRVAYLAYNSPVSFARFQKKHVNRYGVTYDFVPKEAKERHVSHTAEQITGWEEYANQFKMNIHANIVSGVTDKLIMRDGIEIEKYIGKEKEVRIPDFVHSIAKGAFERSSVRKVILNKRLKNIGNDAFSTCPELEEVVMSESLQSVGMLAFRDCPKLRRISFPATLKELGSGAFRDCDSLESVDLSQTAIVTLAHAFKECPSLKEVRLPQTLTSIDLYCFERCVNLKEINLPDSLERLGASVFEACHSLREVALPEKLLGMDDRVFYGCHHLRKVTVGKSLVSIPVDAFGSCEALRELIVSPDNLEYEVVDRCLLERHSKTLVFPLPGVDKIPSKAKAIGPGAFRGRALRSIVVPEGVTSIGANAFSSNPLLEKVTLPESLTLLSKQAFMDCVSLKEIVLPKGITFLAASLFEGCFRLASVQCQGPITHIGERVFAGASSLESFAIPETVEFIGYRAFANTHLREVRIPAGVREIRPFAFAGCQNSITRFEVDPLNTIYDSRDGCNALIRKKHTVLLFGCAKSFIPSGVITIAPGAFADCHGLKGAVEGLHVTVIGARAFMGCDNVEKMWFPELQRLGDKACYGMERLEEFNLYDSLVSIGGECFSNCQSLASVRIPSSLASIGGQTFQNCRALTEISLGNFSISLDPKLFTGCVSLRKIVFEGEHPSYLPNNNNLLIERRNKQVVFAVHGVETIPEGVLGLHPKCFISGADIKRLVLPSTLQSFPQLRNLRNLEEVVFPEELPGLISGYVLSLAHCVSLKRFVFPSYGDKGFYDDRLIPAQWHLGSMFEGCVNLEEVVLPEGIEVIQDRAFQGCSNLKSIRIPSSVRLIGERAFYDCANLEEVVLPSSLEKIGSLAFAGCKKLASCVLPETVKEIGNFAFFETAIPEVVIPPSVQKFGRAVFAWGQLKSIKVEPGIVSFYHDVDGRYLIQDENGLLLVACGNEVPEGTKAISSLTYSHNESITELKVPEGVTSIHSDAFSGCENLRSVSLPSSLKTIAPSAFASCEKLEEVSFGNQLESIGHHAFVDCASLRELQFPESLQSVDASAFSGCLSLRKAALPRGVRYIGAKVFNSCPLQSLYVYKEWDLDVARSNSFEGIANPAREIIVEKGNPIYHDGNGSNVLCFGSKLILGSEKGSIPEGTTIIGDSAFAGCKAISSIAFPKSLERIAGSAFAGTNLKEIVLNEGLFMIGDKAFDGSPLLTSVSIPSTVKEISRSAFGNCPSLKHLSVKEGNPWFSSRNETIYGPDQGTLQLGCAGSSIDEKTERISPCAFLYVPLEEIHIPFTVAKLAENSFDARATKRVTIDAKNPYYNSVDAENGIVSTREHKLLWACAETKMKEGLKAIGGSAFSRVSNAGELVLPASVTYVARDAFGYGPDISSITVEEGNPVFDSRDGCNALIITRINKAMLTCKQTKLPEGVELLSEIVQPEEPGHSLSLSWSLDEREQLFRSLSVGGERLANPSDLPF